MSGKFLNCLIRISLFLAVSVPLFAAVKADELKKSVLYINGYNLKSYEKGDILGLRAKAVADMYYRKSNFSKAIQFYEEASRHLPNEAEVYFNLANIYVAEQVYNLAASYYNRALEKFILPENATKTKKFFYLSMIGYAYSLEKSKNYGDNHDKAKKAMAELMRAQQEIQESFPELIPELDKLNRLMYGDVMIIKMR